MNKIVYSIYSPPAACAAPGAVPVKVLFNHPQHSPQLSPFFRLQHTGPLPFTASDAPASTERTLCQGWALLSIVYSGTLAYSDSTGASGTLGAGDVQWSRAGSGVIRHESLLPAAAPQPSALEVVQLWANVPVRSRMDPPYLHHLCHTQMPAVPLPDQAGLLRVIAGEYCGYHSAARTLSPMTVWDVRLRHHADAMLELPEQHTLLVLIVHGSALIGGKSAHAGQWVHLSRTGRLLMVQTEGQTCDLLVLSGAPIPVEEVAPQALPPLTAGS